MGDLTNDFSWDELTRSDNAIRFEVDNTPDDQARECLEVLAVQILQPTRDALTRMRGKDTPLIVTSGFRNERVNEMAGGSTNSAHRFGRASDHRAIGMSAADLARWYANGDLPYDKVILEFDRWVHIQIPKPGNRARQLEFTAVKRDGKTVYLSGLV